MVKLLLLQGFVEKRQKGSHIIFKHTDGRSTLLPFHNEDLSRGLIRKILNDIEISIDDYENLRKKI